ncbi:hypothetical protein GJ744_009582 [Endocarpon pusillum]|uniref:Uncharacterized protein n=1 Tax=Endocarpon pusillum TaxID=364733 RepID=A0A8H7AJB0_9EURO|nr:hypothetical protein GJ744_009582 [Endocarpon pusillum]
MLSRKGFGLAASPDISSAIELYKRTHVFTRTLSVFEAPMTLSFLNGQAGRPPPPPPKECHGEDIDQMMILWYSNNPTNPAVIGEREHPKEAHWGARRPKKMPCNVNLTTKENGFLYCNECRLTSRSR